MIPAPDFVLKDAEKVVNLVLRFGHLGMNHVDADDDGDKQNHKHPVSHLSQSA